MTSINLKKLRVGPNPRVFAIADSSIEQKAIFRPIFNFLLVSIIIEIIQSLVVHRPKLRFASQAVQF
ncbi:MAG: hypothetical protein CBC55_01245 [Gammaproteobacteria bacterium TMED95]|nr:hypothetical protein [Gammaproteobacteria bacterium]OUV23419.1 MAG: hypothetical protein CBC55_01245 [Gammaproteobacteria bacterium TMED95]